MARKQITTRQQRIIAMGEVEGVPQKQIAKAARVSLSTVRYAKQRYPEVRSMMEQFVERHKTQIQEIGDKLIDHMCKHADSPDYWQAADVGKRFVDMVKAVDEVRGFGGKKDATAVNVTVNQQNTISLGALMQIAAREDEEKPE